LVRTAVFKKGEREKEKGVGPEWRLDKA